MHVYELTDVLGGGIVKIARAQELALFDASTIVCRKATQIARIQDALKLEETEVRKADYRLRLARLAEASLFGALLFSIDVYFVVFSIGQSEEGEHDHSVSIRGLGVERDPLLSAASFSPCDLFDLIAPLSPFVSRII